MDKVGKDGTITVEEAKSIETTLDVVEGMQFDKGYLSPYFVTNAEAMEAMLEDAYILIHEKKISSLKDLLPLLEKVAKSRQAAPHHRGRSRRRSARDPRREQAPRHLQRRAVKAPGFGDRRKAMLEDIAILTGGQCITEDLGIKLENVELEDLGRAKRITDRQGKHHHRRRRRQAVRHPGPRQPDPPSDRRNHLAITTARSSRSASRSSPAAWPSSTSAPRPKPK